MTNDAGLHEILHVALDNAIVRSLEPARATAILATMSEVGAVRATETVVKVQPISNRRLNALSEWFLEHGFALTRRNWCELKKKVNSDETLGDMTGDEKEHADEAMRMFREEDR